MAMAYIYLAAAIVFEVLGTLSLKYTEGFTKVIPIILTCVCHGICFVALAAALKSLPVSLVYSMWAGIGMVIMAVIGLWFFNEPLPLQKVLATIMIVIGVVLLNFTSEEKAEHLAKGEAVKLNSSQSGTPHREVSSQRNSG